LGEGKQGIRGYAYRSMAFLIAKGERKASPSLLLVMGIKKKPGKPPVNWYKKYMEVKRELDALKA
jgi:hypothetical protein